MVFSSLTFITIFLPLILIIYFAVPHHMRAIRNYILLLFSVIFYSWGEPVYIFLIVVSIIFTYTLSKLVSKRSKWALLTVVIINLLPLAAFKYTDFIIVNINAVFNTNINSINISLPIGISFYTFQILTYVIDLYRNKVKRQDNPMYLALYVFLFPQLIAGPIVRYETIENQIVNRKENWSDFKAGIGRFVIGLAKKVLIANQAGYISKVIMEQEPGFIGVSMSWLAAFSFAIQIYFDFSGYSDMAIGLGRIFGFHFLENFNYPYVSKSITEFWRRWHISLSTFFRDYVYIPMGGNRVALPRFLLNMFVIWFLTGFWHGASWNFIIWGLYYCVLLIVEKLLLNKILTKIPSFFTWLYTFIMTLFGWVIFMVETNNPFDIIEHLRKMFVFKSDGMILTIRSLELQPYIPFLLIGFILSFPITSKIKDMSFMSNKLVIAVRDLTVALLYAVSLAYIISESFNPFMYFRF